MGLRSWMVLFAVDAIGGRELYELFAVNAADEASAAVAAAEARGQGGRYGVLSTQVHPTGAPDIDIVVDWFQVESRTSYTSTPVSEA